MRLWLTLFAALVVVPAAGCRDFTLTPGIPCSKTGMCPSPFQCRQDRCVAVDGGAGHGASGSGGGGAGQGAAGMGFGGAIGSTAGTGEGGNGGTAGDADASDGGTDLAPDVTPDSGQPEVPTCPANQHLCPVGCVMNDSPQTCATSCSPCQPPANGGTATCVAGKCDGTCPQGKKLCLGACIDAASPCGSTCPSDTHLCGQTCPSSMDINACGTSCVPCAVPANAEKATCDGKTCGFACKNGFRNCPGTNLCISSALPGCCSSGECTGGGTGTVGICTNNVCGYSCNTPTYKACNGACILSTGCCTAAECAGVCSTCTTNACVAVKSADDTDSCAGTCDANGACKSKQGQTCTMTSGGCVGGTSCVEGTCCNSACSSKCTSCLAANTGKANGTCAPVTAGLTHGSDCATSASTSCLTTGKCDGAGNCSLWPSGTMCAGKSCPQGSTSQTDVSMCNGSGICVSGAMTSCLQYLCNASTASCRMTCSSSGDCSSGNYCSGTSCVAKKINGKVCGAATECASGLCGGRCCAAGTTCTCPQPSATNVVTNAGFDANLSGWTVVNDGFGFVNWASDDSDGCPYSGSVEIRTNRFAGTQYGPKIWQCMPVSGGAQYNFGARFRNADDAASQTSLCMSTYCDIEWFGGASCTGSNLTPVGSPRLTWSNRAWYVGGPGTAVSAPVDALAAKITCYTDQAYDSSSSECFGRFDRVFLTPDPGQY